MVPALSRKLVSLQETSVIDSLTQEIAQDRLYGQQVYWVEAGAGDIKRWMAV